MPCPTAKTVLAARCAPKIRGRGPPEIGYRRAYATGDLERVESAAQTLTALGRDSSRLHIALGTLRNDRGDREGALLEFGRSQTLFPSALTSHPRVLAGARNRG